MRRHDGGMFGDKLRAAIGGLALKQNAAALRIGMTATALSMWLNGERTPEFAGLLKLRRAFPEIDFNWLLDDDAADAPPVYRPEIVTPEPVVGRLVSQRARPASSTGTTPRTAARKPRRKA